MLAQEPCYTDTQHRVWELTVEARTIERTLCLAGREILDKLAVAGAPAGMTYHASYSGLTCSGGSAGQAPVWIRCVLPLRPGASPQTARYVRIQAAHQTYRPVP